MNISCNVFGFVYTLATLVLCIQCIKLPNANVSGQKSADDEPPSKKSKTSAPKKPEPTFKSKLDPRPSKAPTDHPQVSYYSGVDTSMPDSTSAMEDPKSILPLVQAQVPAAVSSVTITRRDPRTAGHRSSVPLTLPDVGVPALPASIPVPVEPLVVEAKGPLPMPPPAPTSLPKPAVQKPASSQDARHYGSSVARYSTIQNVSKSSEEMCFCVF